MTKIFNGKKHKMQGRLQRLIEKSPVPVNGTFWKDFFLFNYESLYMTSL